MNKYLAWMFVILSTGLFSCGVIRDTPKYTFADGYYSSKVFAQQESKVYVDNSEDLINVYPVVPGDKSFFIDTSNSRRLSFPQLNSSAVINSNSFRQASFDIDFLTIPFKFRPPSKSLPSQFNTNLNGAVYFGFRNDTYRLWYKKTPVNGYIRQTTHYGFSFGLLSGLGGTAMNPWVTENQIASEYDGVVWSKGIGAIIGINNFTIGLVFGFDNILDKNRKYWIYQGKPWLGVAFGLNLN